MSEYFGTKADRKGNTMAVFDIRGTHGSGKSYLVHTLLKKYRSEPIIQKKKHIGYFIPDLDCGVIGRYSTACGGCDGVGKQDEVVRRIRLFSRRYRHVVLEGILVSHTFKRYAKIAKRAEDYRFLFLDTPLKVCISRVRKRRLAKGNKKELDPKNVIKDHHNIWDSVRNKCIAAGCCVKILDWRDPFPDFIEMLIR